MVCARMNLRSKSLLLIACLAWASPIFGQNPSATPLKSEATPAASTTPAMAPAPKDSVENTDAKTSVTGPKISYSSVTVSEPYVALTFDDGPHATLTPKLLDILKARHVKATFFVVGENAAQYPEILKRIVAEGHEIGNHSWSHPVFAKMSEGAVRSEVQRTQDAVTQGAGVTPTILRPPYGSITDLQRHWLNQSFGFHIIMWSVDPLDWKNRNSETVARRILAETRPGSIVLSHDIHATTVEAMPNVIDSLLAKGFKFKTVSELIALDQPVVKTAVSSAKESEKKSKKSK